MWLTGRLAPDFKTIANFRHDNGPAIRAVCGQFIELCRRLHLFTKAIVAIDGSKFKAVNDRDKNFTLTKVAKRMEQVDASIARYLTTLDRADREESDIAEAKTRRQTVEHPFGTLKSWMGSAHFLTKTLEKVRTEMSLHVLAYNMKRMIRIFGVGPLLEAMRA